MRTRPWLLAITLVLTTAFACGGDKKKKPYEDDGTADPAKKPATDPAKPDPAKPGTGGDQTATTPATPDPAGPRPATKPMGAEKVSLFNYVYSKGKKAHGKAEKAAKKKDWAAVKTHCQAAIEKDPWHLHAHHDLATAMVQLGEIDAAVEHLDIALAGDWLRWGPGLTDDADLAPLWQAPAGDKVKALSQAYGEEFMQRVKGGLWMLGRRSRYKRPEKVGEQWSATRGELYAYDLETQRYLRITHTRERIAGWLRSPSGDQIAWLGYWQVVVPDPASSAADPETDPVAASDKKPAGIIFRRTLVGVIDANTLLPIGKVATLREDIARADLQYRVGDELILSVFADFEGWNHAGETGEPSQRYAFDREAGKLKKTDVAPSDEPVLTMTLEKTWTTRKEAAGFEVNDGEDGEVLMLDGMENGVPIPDQATVVGVSRSPDKAYALVRTVGEPCAESPSGSLYSLDTATGKLAHILRGNSEFHVSWLDDRRFAYEDDGGRVRIHDLGEGKQLEKLKNGAVLSLSGLGATRGIMCTE